jgi:hypothetical protein
VNEQWNSFLTTRGDKIDPDIGDLLHRGQSQIRTLVKRDCVADLSHLALIRVNGADAAEYLNGQFTTDVRRLQPHSSQLSAYCEPQGRTLAVFRAMRRHDEFWLCLPENLRDVMINRLRKFVLRARATVNAADDLILIGLAGSGAEQILARVDLVAPQDVASSRDGMTILRAPGQWPRYEIIASVEQAKTLWQELSRRCVPTGSSVWRWHDIQAGIPSVFSQTAEHFVPQSLNLDLLGGIDFAKGCYPGQEIIARVRFRGRIKQRTYRAWVDLENEPRPGDSLYSPDYPSGQAAGTVLDAQAAPEGGCDLLAVIAISVAGGELHIGQIDGPTLESRPLPYLLTDTPR